MSCGSSSAFAKPTVVRRIALLALTLSSLLVSPCSLAVDSGDIVVVSVKGEVHVTMNGKARDVRAGRVLELPATLSTGPDGAVELKQGATTVSVGPETLLEFPALEKRGAPIDRIVQPRGNAFYNIGKREGRKLRVETPYLVGVIKGTQFNVVVQDGAATISLFEGLLDVRSIDDGEAIDLKAGEIASRKRGDKSIGVIKMDGVKAAPTGARAPASTSLNSATTAPSTLAIKSGDTPLLLESNIADAPSNTDVLTGSASSVEVGAGAVDVATNVDGNPGPPAVDVVATGGADLGAPTVDTTTSTTIDAPLTIDTGTAATVDLGAGTAGTIVDVGATAPPAQVDVGVGAAVDPPVGTIDLGVPVPGVDLDVDLGLDDDDGNNGHGNDADGIDSSNPGHGSDKKGPGNSDSGDLVDVRHPNKK